MNIYKENDNNNNNESAANWLPYQNGERKKTSGNIQYILQMNVHYRLQSIVLFDIYSHILPTEWEKRQQTPGCKKKILVAILWSAQI